MLTICLEQKMKHENGRYGILELLILVFLMKYDPTNETKSYDET